MEGTRVRFPEKLILAPEHHHIDTAGNDCQGPLENSDRVGEAAHVFITERDLLQDKKVARIELDRALQIAQALLLLAAAA